MLSSLWRRKNEKLIERLNAAVETVERARESYENHTPRVAIDTSYVDRQREQEREAEANALHQGRAARITGAQDDSTEHAPTEHGHDDQADDERSDVLNEAGTAAHGGGTAPSRSDAHHLADALADSDASGDDLLLIREAVEQLELADRREAESRAEAESQRERAELAEAAIASEQAARREAEAQAVRAGRRAGELEKEIQSLRASTAEVEELRETVAQLKGAQSRADELRLREEAAQQEIKELKARAEEAESAFVEAEGLLSKLEQRVEDAEKVAEEAQSNLEPLRNSAKEAEANAAREADKRKSIEAELAAERTAHKEAAAKHEEAGRALAAAECELAGLRKSATAAGEVPRLEKEIAELKAAHAKAEAALKTAEAAREKAETSLKSAETARREADDKRIAAERERDAAKDASKAEIEDLRKALAKATDAEELEQWIAELEATLAKEKQAHRETDDRRTKAERDLAAARSELEGLRKSEAKSAEKSADRDNLAKRVAELEASLAKEQKSLRESDDKRTNAERDLAAARSELETLRKSSQKSGEAEQQAKHIAELEASLADARKGREAAEQSVADIKSEMAALKASTEEARKTLGGDSQKLMRVEARLLGEQNARRDAEAALKKAEQAASELRAEMEALKAATSRDKDAGDRSDAELDAARIEVDELKNRVKRLEAEVEQKEALRREALSEVERIELNAADIRHELVSLRTAAQQLDVARNLQASAEAALESQRAELEDKRRRVVELEEALAIDKAAHHAAEQQPAKPDRERSARADELAALRSATGPIGRLVDIAAATAASLRGDSGRVPEVHYEESHLSEHDDAWADGSAEPTIDFEDRNSDRPGVLVGEKPTTPEQHTPQSLIERRKAMALGGERHAVGNSNRRNAQRVSSSMPVTLWREGLGQAINCTLIDKSSTGAKLDVEPDRYLGNGIAVSVGDRLTLTFYYAQERTSVFCDVMWIDGTRCGVRYHGQFHTEVMKPKAPAKKRFGAPG